MIKENGKTKRAEDPYQDSVTAPLDHDEDGNIDEEEEEDNGWEDVDGDSTAQASAVLIQIFPAVGKVSVNLNNTSIH